MVQLSSRDDFISARAAIDQAFPIVQDLYVDASIKNMLLEGIELDEKLGVWKITVGFDVEQVRQKNVPKYIEGLAESMSSLTVNTVTNRVMKNVLLDAKDGSFLSMRPI